MTSGLVADEPVLDVDRVSYEVGAPHPLLDDVSLRVGAGEVVALVGRSGSGKTTLCHLAAGLGRPTSGRLLIGGRPAHEMSDWSTVSLLPQRLGLVEELSVEQNVLLPCALRRGARAKDHGAIDGANDGADGVVGALFAALDLTELRPRTAGQTSLGEQQRTALARALVLRPRLAVLDEPTGHQDDDHVELVVAALEVARAAGVALLVATHDERLVGAADRVVGLHDGRVVQA
jgi:ABC-type lipoprotein export system ATPase subunit